MHLLISGIPASGKTTFCKWLEEKKGLVHLDAEKPGVLERYELATAWQALFCDGGSAVPFIEALRKFDHSAAIDWGFPPERLDAVRRLRAGGVMLWWFAADWAVARRSFTERRRPAIELFDIQMRKIQAALSEINAVFSSHVVYALPSTGIHTRPEEIWQSMLDTLVESARKT